MTAPGSYPPPTASGPPPPPPPERPSSGAGRVADLTITILLIVVLALLGILSLYFGLFLAMASDSCSGDDACATRVGLAVLVVELAPVVAWLPTTIWAMVRMARGKIAFWVPLLAIPIYLAVAAAGLLVLGG